MWSSLSAMAIIYGNWDCQLEASEGFAKHVADSEGDADGCCCRVSVWNKKIFPMQIAISNIADNLNSNLKGFFMPKVPKCKLISLCLVPTT